MPSHSTVSPAPGRVRGWTRRLLPLLLAALSARPVPVDAAEIVLTLQSRKPGGDETVRTPERVEARRIGVVAVDVWNHHWCKTATERVAALVPRINAALDAARDLGMTVMLCPSDVVDNYAGTPQREAALALPAVAVPDLPEPACPAPPDAGGCACGRERCAVNYGWDGMHPDLRIGDGDLMPDTRAEVYAICQARGLTHLIYVGFHTQVCLLGKPMGLRAMRSAGLRCVLARDLTDAHPGYDPATGFTPDLNTARVVRHFEEHLAPTVDLGAELARLGRWDPAWAADPVRITPWGTARRPHLFDRTVVVTLSAPLTPDAEIRYTLDGTDPGAGSARYDGPFEVARTTRVRAAAYRRGLRVAAASDALFVLRGPLPPRPDVHLGELPLLRTTGFGHTYGGEVRYSGRTGPPRPDRANTGEELRIERGTHGRGIGVHAPNSLTYAVPPRAVRFVARAGVDENLVRLSNGSNLARHPSVVFKVLLDGREAASSPVMRIQSPAWHFDVGIPSGTRRIRLVTTDAGDGSREDLADWVDAGFVLEE